VVISDGQGGGTARWNPFDKLRAGSSLRPKNGYAQDDAALERSKLTPLPKFWQWATLNFDTAVERGGFSCLLGSLRAAESGINDDSCIKRYCSIRHIIRSGNQPVPPYQHS
jgi:hypothetical protein